MTDLEVASIVCVFDQALYAKACDIKWKEPDEYKSVVLRMGAFHTVCNLLSVIGKRFQDGGLRDLIVETEIIAEGSVNSALYGKMYNRGL